MEVDVFNHSQLEVSNLNGDPLSCNDIGSIQTTHGKPDAEIDVSQSVLEKTYRVQNDDYKINDIVWAKIGKYPFWPSIVCVHPISNTYIKTSKTNKIELHVRFCNDRGKHCWTSYFEKYSGESDLLTKYPYCLSSIKKNKKLLNVWNSAVKEAENLKKLDGAARMFKFFSTFSNSDKINCSTPSLDTATFSKVHAYSKKRLLTHSDQSERSKLMKTDNSSVTSCSSRTIDISPLSKSKIDDKNKNPLILEEKTSTQTRQFAKKKELEIFTNEEIYQYKKTKNSLYSGYSSTKIMKSTESVNKMNSNNDNQKPNTTLYSESPSTSKKKTGKMIPHEKESSVGRKSTTVKNESSTKPGTTESETSSKNETYSPVFFDSTNNNQLFLKGTKKACVVCKNNKDTVKCLGLCQSYFHKECLDSSKEKYCEPVNKIVSKGKNQCLKSTHRKSSSNTEHNILEENATESNKCDNFLSSPINYTSSMSEVVNKNTQLDNCQNATKGLVTEMSKKEIVTPVKNMMAEKGFKNDRYIMCNLCKADKIHCYGCSLNIKDPKQKIVCKVANCGKVFHQKCLEKWPQCQWAYGSQKNVRCVICPHHICHLCISDNPEKACTNYHPNEKLIRCIKCLTAYHKSEYCLPAGSQILSDGHIICGSHFQPKKNDHFLTCFNCELGGTLVWCNLCPSSFHIECLNQNPSKLEGSFTCGECQAGRYPLYGEIVWVKKAKIRWWPAKIIFPHQVPDSVNTLPHSVGQFVVKFFGTNDHNWVDRGSVFNFVKGDDVTALTKTVEGKDHVYQDAVIEAAQSHNTYILGKNKLDTITVKQSLTLPPKYQKIKFNRPYGNVKNMEPATTPMTACDCDPFKPNPCGLGSDCINRMLMLECQPKLCPAREKCNNQSFQKVLCRDLKPFLTKGRGWGLVTLEDIKEGSFVVEYVGEVIDKEEFHRRLLEMKKQNEQNYYFLTIDNNRIIDAYPKGNLSRFLNHSCEPNCILQKWVVNGDTRIGIFALHDIQAGTELVIDYQWSSSIMFEKKPCQCGAAKCSKFIGVKVKEEKKKKIPKNDSDKCKTSTKNKQKPLKIKTNIKNKFVEDKGYKSG